MSETPWYLVDHETMREYAEAVALYEVLSGLTFDHADPFADWRRTLSLEIARERINLLEQTGAHKGRVIAALDDVVDVEIEADDAAIAHNYRVAWVLSRALRDMARDLDCTFEELKAACEREVQRRLAALPPPDDEPQSLDVETVEESETVTAEEVVDGTVTPIWRM